MEQRCTRTVEREVFEEAFGGADEHLALCAARKVHRDMRVVEAPQRMSRRQRFGRGDIEKGRANALAPEYQH